MSRVPHDTERYNTPWFHFASCSVLEQACAVSLQFVYLCSLYSVTFRNQSITQTTAYLNWNKTKTLNRLNFLNPVREANQTGLVSPLGLPHWACSTAPQHERYPPLSRTSVELIAQHLKTNKKPKQNTLRICLMLC